MEEKVPCPRVNILLGLMSASVLEGGGRVGLGVRVEVGAGVRLAVGLDDWLGEGVPSARLAGLALWLKYEIPNIARMNRMTTSASRKGMLACVSPLFGMLTLLMV
jgi:hypothetical protein